MSDYAEIEYDDCVKETDMAVCIKIDKRDHWIPRSMLDDEEQIPYEHDGGGEYGSCFVKTFWAEKNGLV